MDLILLALAAILMLVGILGSFLPMLPGIPVSWVGLLLLHLTQAVPVNYPYLGITLLVTLIIFALQYAIPALGTKYLGGSKKGMVGATIGLFAGIFIPIPFAILIAPFIGAYLGEIVNKADSRTALKAASGSFIGLLASTFMEFVVTAIFLLLFIYKVWEYRIALF
ncbi:DUF456 domain-containing protein [Salinimicrobium tongyeongense]|jgi:hypothetical protein|uniref:DUF456 domain-containing protein n=1 Tax=Salinimicrobium tongyeongense TaxID=2809707 RepID=A0ABY6NMM3_9FLAO|nr:DUF456 domain-containing protein [Salinimicrobium tongyeongense]UZH54134.1 DUF456 domain-containing protein [Salinimicrobium tongyeongense]